MSNQNFTQNSARNPKIRFKIFFVKKCQTLCSFQGLWINFWIQCFYRIYWQVTWNYNSCTTWMRPKVEVNYTNSIQWCSTCKDRKNLVNQWPPWNYFTVFLAWKIIYFEGVARPKVFSSWRVRAFSMTLDTEKIGFPRGRI